MPKPYFHQTTSLNGKVVTLQEFREYRASLPPLTAEQIAENARMERIAESYEPRFKGQYSKWHFSQKRTI